MRLKFTPALDSQREAIDAIAGVFDGQPEQVKAIRDTGGHGAHLRFCG